MPAGIVFEVSTGSDGKGVLLKWLRSGDGRIWEHVDLRIAGQAPPGQVARLVLRSGNDYYARLSAGMDQQEDFAIVLSADRHQARRDRALSWRFHLVRART